MSKGSFIVITLLAAGLLSLAAGPIGGLAVEENPENVAASRMEGDWITDAALTERLRGKAGKERRLSFRSDPAVAGRVPGKYEEFFAGRAISMAGTMTVGDDEYPFVLTEVNGNPHVLFFRERGGDPMGDAESFILMYAKARDPANDILFTGGDFNNEPHTAYRRVTEDEAAEGGR